jgi:hypothetical protein
MTRYQVAHFPLLSSAEPFIETAGVTQIFWFHRPFFAPAVAVPAGQILAKIKARQNYNPIIIKLFDLN